MIDRRQHHHEAADDEEDVDSEVSTHETRDVHEHDSRGSDESQHLDDFVPTLTYGRLGHHVGLRGVEPSVRCRAPGHHALQVPVGNLAQRNI